MANISARLRRIAADWEQVRQDFAGHKNIVVTPAGGDPPEQYHVTYYVNGIFLLPGGQVQTLTKHEVDIILHSDYPRYKPICKISTPIWHPNFRDGQICIGDIWGAGESLTDIIINIGDMIQYKSWNSSSPLSADAAKWAIENKHLFPVGNVNLHIADYAAMAEGVEIDVGEEPSNEKLHDSAAKPQTLTETSDETAETADSAVAEATADAAPEENSETTEAAAVDLADDDGNDIEITAEELEGIEFVPTAQRMQTVPHGGTVKGNKINFKTILTKGLIWAIVGAILGFGFSEIISNSLLSTERIATVCGYENLADYFRLSEETDKASTELDKYFQRYCKEHDLDPESSSSFEEFYMDDSDPEAQQAIEDYLTASDLSDEAFYYAYTDDFNEDEDAFVDAIKKVNRYHTGVWAASIALFIGLFLGIGEGVYYGSVENAVKFGLIGAGISLVIGFVSGYIAQYLYIEMITDSSSDFYSAFVRGVGWALMGIGVGLAIGLIKPDKKRILFCCIGGFTGAFLGGFLFNYVCDIVSHDVIARGVAIVLMGMLTGLGVGLLEQFAKAAWLKVIRGEFEGKEYLVFAGTTSIGNSGKNNIVLFKDKLVAPHHCDIILEGTKYIIVDQGSPLGTIVNGMKTTRHNLKHGDTIAIGNSVLVFNSK